MGADCIISGIRPQIAQTMVHLGVELNVVSFRSTCTTASPWRWRKTSPRGSSSMPPKAC
jgi:rsbT co-antagonist protein RsbR